jgi:hypothetical protein
MDKEKQKKGDNKSSILAENLFVNALAQSAAEHLEKFDTDLARGATEQAIEHLKQTRKALAYCLTHLTSERLSKQENQLNLNLQARKFMVSENGNISWRFLSPNLENLYERLSRKAGQ